MKVGYTASIIGHALILSWGALSFPAAKPYEVAAVDALPVDLIPISDVTKLSTGTKTAPKRDTASPAKVKTPAPRPDSQRVGNAPIDQDTPITEKTTETAAPPRAEPKAATPPPPPPARDPAPEPAAPKATPAPEKPVESTARPTADVGEVAATPEAPPEEPKPAPVPPTIQPRQKPAKPTEVASLDRKPAPPSPETSRSEQTRPVDETSPQRSQETESEFDPTEMAALLNKVDPSGGGALDSTQDASLGSENETNAVADMTQSEIDALRSAIEACWNPPIGTEAVEGMVVPLRIEFNIDGSIASPPQIKSIPPGPVGQATADAAAWAVQVCAPYTFLPPEKYENWRVVNINFRPPSL